MCVKCKLHARIIFIPVHGVQPIQIMLIYTPGEDYAQLQLWNIITSFTLGRTNRGS